MRGKVSVIVLAYEPSPPHRQSTERCLGALRAFTDMPHEVVLIDNGSPLAANVSRDTQGVRRVRLGRNVSLPEAWNLGAQASAGDLLVFLHNDQYVGPGWLAALVSLLDNGADIAGPESWQFDEQGALRRTYPDQPLPGSPNQLAYVSVAGLTIRRGHFEQLGGFDPALGPSRGFDADLCWRAQAEGLRVGHCPGAPVRHVGALTLDALDPSAPQQMGLLVRKWKARLERRHRGVVERYLPTEVRPLPTVLVVRPGGLGDVLMLTPTLRELHRQGNRVSLVTNRAYLPLVARLPFLDRVYPTDECPNANAFSAVYGLTNFAESHGDRQRTDRISLFATGLRVTLKAPRPTCVVGESAARAADALFESWRFTADKPTIAVQGSGEYPHRSWQPSHVVAFARLCLKAGWQVIVLHDRDLGFRAPARAAKCIGRPLDVVAAVLQKCGVVVAPDSGLAHLAAAVGVPFVALFGAIRPELRLRHYSSYTLHYPRHLPCVPCFEPHGVDWGSVCDYECMRSITPQAVFDDIAAHHLALPRHGRFGRSLSVAMVTWNEAEYIGACLERIEQIADEVVVVDGNGTTMSTDGTVEIAQAFGARVVPFDGGCPCGACSVCDDRLARGLIGPDAAERLRRGFCHSKGRMMGFDLCRGDYILRLDADELLHASDAERLKRRTVSMPAWLWTLQCPTVNLYRDLRHYKFGKQGYFDWYPDWHERIYKNSPRGAWGFHNPHHQNGFVLMCDQKVMGWDLPTERLPDLRFFHYGYLKPNTPERQARYARGGDQTHILDGAHVEALPWEPPL